MLKVKRLAFLLMIALVVTLAIQVVDAAQITGSITSDRSEIITHESVTVTCTYTSTASTSGSGDLSLSGPYADKDSPIAFKRWDVIYSWDGYPGLPDTNGPLLVSGVPVTHTIKLDQPGYYKFKWECGSSDGAYTWVIVHVVDTPTVLPEAPPIAALAIGFAALGLFVAITKKRSGQMQISTP